ncbi:methyltransferase [Acidobacteriota bacterium]
MNPKECPPQAQMMQFIVGKWISKPIYAAAELGIADMLVNGPKSIAELARISKTHALSLYRMMRALSSVGIFTETGDKQFELTPMAECLKTGSLRSAAITFNAPWNDRAWFYFLDSVKTGVTAFEKAHGMPISQWLEKNPPEAVALSEANAIKAAMSHRAIVDVYDFSGIDTLTDVGAGYGTLLAEILLANPRMKGIAVDLPHVIGETKKMIGSKKLADRCQVLECDFFQNIPVGSDAYLLSYVLHDWPDDRCREILKNCSEAMKQEAKLLIVEILIPPGNVPSVGKLLDLEMFVLSGGRERTEVEYKELLESSGFKLSRVIFSQESISIIEAIPL